MAVTINAQAGSNTANSYATLDEAIAYMDTRLHKTSWQAAGTEDKKRALVWATRLLDDQVAWKGIKASNTQSLRWPREYCPERDSTSGGGYENFDSGAGNPTEYLDGTEIPTFLINATVEFAMFLLAEDRTLETNRDLMGFKRMRVDVIEMEVDPWTKRPLLPASVWNIIKWYAETPGGLTLVRA